jgi:hypothetical protein
MRREDRPPSRLNLLQTSAGKQAVILCHRWLLIGAVPLFVPMRPFLRPGLRLRSGRRAQGPSRLAVAPWIEAAKKRLHPNVLAIALANKLARIAWAVLNKEHKFEFARTNTMTSRRRFGATRGRLRPGVRGPAKCDRSATHSKSLWRPRGHFLTVGYIVMNIALALILGLMTESGIIRTGAKTYRTSLRDLRHHPVSPQPFVGSRWIAAGRPRASSA